MHHQMPRDSVVRMWLPLLLLVVLRASSEAISNFAELNVTQPGVFRASAAGAGSIQPGIASWTPTTASITAPLFGTATYGVGDLNGDGLEEFAVAAPMINAADVKPAVKEAGIIFVFWGTSSLAWSTNPSAVWHPLSAFPNASLGFLVSGTTESQKLGDLARLSSVACDLNGDTIGDLILGDEATVFVVFGHHFDWPAIINTSDIGTLVPGFRIPRPPAGVNLFINPQCAKDTNGDAMDELLFVSQLASGPKNIVVMLYGQSSWPSLINYTTSSGIYGARSTLFISSKDGLGTAMGSLDLNMDGFNDIVVSDQTDTVYVVWGNQSLIPSLSLPVGSNTIGLNLKSGSWGDVIAIGDFNGDNFPDLIVGTSLISVTVVFAHSGTWQLNAVPSNSVTFSSDSSDGFAKSIACGDLNGDNMDDLFVGANFDAGFVYVFYGSKSSSALSVSKTVSPNSANWSRINGVAYSLLGFSVGVVHGVAGASDNIIAGARGGASSAYLVSGASCQVMTSGKCSRCFVGYGLQESMGTCTACIGQTFSDGTTSCKTTTTVESCISFTQAGTCLQCKPGTEIKFAKCFSCTNNTWSNGTTPCQSCTLSDSCTECRPQTGMCSKCPPGYTLMGTGCSKCSGNKWSTGTDTICRNGPKNCSTWNEGNCSTCLSGFQLTSEAQCAECTGNTYSQDGHSCKTGPSNCATLNRHNGTCLACKGGFASTNNTCIPCTEGTTWSLGASASCTTCKSNGCLSCTSATGICTKCVLGMKVNPNTQASCSDDPDWHQPTQQVEITLSSNTTNVTQVVHDIAVQLQISENLIQVVLIPNSNIITVTVPTSVVEDLNKIINNNKVPNVISVRVIPTDEQKTVESGNGGLGVGGIVGIVVGCCCGLGVVVVVGLIVVVIVLTLKHHKSRRHSAEVTMTTIGNSTAAAAVPEYSLDNTANIAPLYSL